MTTATSATSRSCGSTAWTSRWCASSTPGFAEKSAQEHQTVLRPEGDALARFGANMLPVDFEPAPAEPTQLFVYPYERSRSALATLARGTPDPHHGFKQRFVNPATGASPMPTIGAFAQWLPKRFETRPVQRALGRWREERS